MPFELGKAMHESIPPGNPEDEAGLRLDEQILEYIKQHQEGVRITTMEQKFRESRMRIGFITKRLLNEGKILRIQDDFYPPED